MNEEGKRSLFQDSFSCCIDRGNPDANIHYQEPTPVRPLSGFSYRKETGRLELSALDESHQNHDDGHDQKYVDEAAHGVIRHQPEEPGDDQN